MQQLVNPGNSRVVGAVAIALAAALCVALGRAPAWLPVGYLGIGVVSIGAYWVDKSAAEAGRWRVPERSLHVVDLLGGTIGGLVAQALLRHKTRKPSFAATTWMIAAPHLVGLCLLAAWPA